MCALHIGDADNLDNFIGEIDEVRKFDVSDFFEEDKSMSTHTDLN